MKLGISSCLLGNFCRYDGAHAKDDFVVNVLANYFEFVPYCPEKIIFGTPRESIRLIEMDEQIKVFTNNSLKEVTHELEEISQTLSQQMADDELCGIILKSKSPTCGMERVKVYQPNSSFNEKKAEGVFAKAIKEKYPYLPMEEEGRLHDPWLRENFLMQLFAYKDLFSFLQSNPSMNDLVQFHTGYKYLIYAKSQLAYKALGQIVANHEKLPMEKLLKEYQVQFLKAITLKGDKKKTYNVLLHIFGYFKKLITKEEKQDLLEAIDEFKEEIIPLIAVIKLLNIYTNRFELEYLQQQKFLHPYPKELALRSDVKAYK